MMDDIGDVHIPIIDHCSDSNNSIVVKSENIDKEHQILSTPQKDSSKKYLIMDYC